MALEASWGRSALETALERATTFRRFKARDVRAILEARMTPTVVAPGEVLDVAAPEAATRSLDAYALERLS